LLTKKILSKLLNVLSEFTQSLSYVTFTCYNRNVISLGLCMTTIAASLEHQLIAADTRCSTDGWMVNVSKLRQGPNTAYGAAGTWEQVLKFYAAIEQNTELSSECDVELLELRADSLYLYNGSLICYPIKEKFWAIGTGAGYAIAAMYLGKDPIEAIRIASLFDPGTGGEIEIMRISDGKPKSHRRRTDRTV
jgi:hypothetical protein